MTATTTDATETALLAAIAAHPDEDTPRLVYADYLEEQPTTSVPCPKCRAKGWVGTTQTVHFAATEFDSEGTPMRRVACRACDGAGNIPDTANRDRAEFIRVQCELARIRSDAESRIANKQKLGDASKGYMHLTSRFEGLPGSRRSVLFAFMGASLFPSTRCRADLRSLPSDDQAHGRDECGHDHHHRRREPRERRIHDEQRHAPRRSTAINRPAGAAARTPPRVYEAAAREEPVREARRREHGEGSGW